MTLSRMLPLLVLILTFTVGPVVAQENQSPEGPRPEGIFTLYPGDAVTDHVLKTRTGDLAYTATAGTLDFFGQNGERTAKVFYTAYVAKERAAGRPLTFVFNGGPGAASAYLHLGLVGPRVLEFGPDGEGGTTPALSDNPDSWLAFTDLVMIDPIGTGWSRAINNDVTGSFYGVRQDADAIAKFISLYVQKNGRTASPKYLLGESYGGFRAAKVASALKEHQGILASGIIMVSPLVEGRFLFGANDDPLSAALQFPALAAAELERQGRFDPLLVSEAERFAMGEYLVSLAGPPPSGEPARALFGRISELTGVPVDVVARTRGFLGDVYAKQAAGPGRVVSPYDAGHVVPDAYPEAAYNRNDDPVLDGFTRAYGPAFVSYARDELGFRTEMTFTLLNEDANRRWEWNGGHGAEGRTSASAAGDLRDLLSVIPSFRILIVHGYSDVLTPWGMSRYVIDHLPPALSAGRAELKLYRGGHMFYTDAASRRSFSEDVRAFYSGKGAN